MPKLYNSFFGRIFLWFWFVTLTSLAAGVLVARLLAPAEQITEPSTIQLERLANAVERIQRIPNLNVNRLQRILNQMSDSRAMKAFVIDVKSKEFIYGFRPPPRGQLNDYRELINEPEAVIYTKGTTRFIGPKRLDVADREFALFIGTTNFPPESRLPLLTVIVLVAILVSGLLCYWLARSFAKPLHEIQSATQRLAGGDLGARVSLSHRRGDEFANLTDETNKMAEQLQRLFTEHQRFLADVSHELRSPLTRLQMAIGIAEQALDDDSSKTFDPNLIQRVIKEADQMDRMISQLLWLSRHEAKVDQFKPHLYEVRELLHPLLLDLEFEAKGQAKKIQVDWKNTAQQVISVDAEMCLHALENVCRNAIKYAASVVEVDVGIANSGLQITISDDGPGVLSAELEKIFSPFYRTDTSRTRDSGGTGLGLSIASRAIERHGGNIVATLRQPNGLTVSIWLPMSNENKAVASR